MRLCLAVIVCKLLRFIGKLVGKGSSLPGQYALKLCPDVLGRVKLPPCVIAVTGSNGKTSTVEMPFSGPAERRWCTTRRAPIRSRGWPP